MIVGAWSLKLVSVTPDSIINSLELYSDHLEFSLGPVLPEGSAVALRSQSEAAFVAEGAALVWPQHQSVACVTFHLAEVTFEQRFSSVQLASLAWLR